MMVSTARTRHHHLGMSAVWGNGRRCAFSPGLHGTNPLPACLRCFFRCMFGSGTSHAFRAPKCSLLDTLPVCQDFNRQLCNRLACRFVHLQEGERSRRVRQGTLFTLSLTDTLIARQFQMLFKTLS
ncbi:hypothetical protein PR048_000225 [Dryococelus australis]|uniref:Uncharacterized protein n=1 Tax=Dryococelus australis TaxID=614101 RepID=A0ABQ9IE19_9NEOP|nr:hypothetical protein PR048_000225 [Dryococelus australis]